MSADGSPAQPQMFGGDRGYPSESAAPGEERLGLLLHPGAPGQQQVRVEVKQRGGGGGSAAGGLLGPPVRG